MNRNAITVTHHPEASRFEALVQGHLALCEYRLRDKVVAFTHTEVPPALEGQGIAGAMVASALDWCRREGFQVKPLCSYVALYIQRRPELQDLLAT
jgi:uncharacterized protein